MRYVQQQEDYEYELNARYDFINELRAEHFDPCWDAGDDEPAAYQEWEDIDF